MKHSTKLKIITIIILCNIAIPTFSILGNQGMVSAQPSSSGGWFQVWKNAILEACNQLKIDPNELQLDDIPDCPPTCICGPYCECAVKKTAVFYWLDYQHDTYNYAVELRNSLRTAMFVDGTKIVLDVLVSAGDIAKIGLTVYGVGTAMGIFKKLPAALDLVNNLNGIVSSSVSIGNWFQEVQHANSKTTAMSSISSIMYAGTNTMKIILNAINILNILMNDPDFIKAIGGANLGNSVLNTLFSLNNLYKHLQSIIEDWNFAITDLDSQYNDFLNQIDVYKNAVSQALNANLEYQQFMMSHCQTPTPSPTSSPSPQMPTPPPTEGPGNDHPDDNFDVSDKISSMTAYIDGTPKIAILNSGFALAARSLLASLGESSVLVDIDVSPDFIKNFPVLIIPTGGLFGLDSSPTFKSILQQYVANGGTLIVFAQQHGYEFNALPSGKVNGVGWLEDQSCQYGSVQISTYHPIMAGQNSLVSNVNVDGYFTNYPENTTILLSRTKNGMPALLEYGFGNGSVIATTAYPDWALEKGQGMSEEISLCKGMIAWVESQDSMPEYGIGDTVKIPVILNNAFLPATIAKYPQYEVGDTVSIPVNVTNTGDSTSTRISFALINPNCEDETINMSISIGPSESKIVNFEYKITDQLMNGFYAFSYSLFTDDTMLAAGSEQGFFVGVNLNEILANKIKFTLLDPDKNIVTQQDTPLNIGDNLSTIDFSYVNPAKLGIWSVTFEVIGNDEGILQSGSKEFAVSAIQSSKNGFISSQSQKITFDVSSDDERYPYGSPAAFVFHLWNKDNIDRSITVTWGLIHHSWYGIVPYGWDNAFSKTILVPKQGEASFTYVLPKVVDLDRLRAIFYDGGFLLGTAEKGFYMFHPSLNLNIQADRNQYYLGETGSIFLNCNNFQKTNYDASITIRVLNLNSNTKVFENTFNQIIAPLSSQVWSIPFQIPTNGGSGLYSIVAQAYVNGAIVSSNSTFVQVSKDHSIELKLNDPTSTYKAGQKMEMDVNLINISPNALITPLTISIPDTNFKDTKYYSLQPNQTGSSHYEVTLPATMTAGKHTIKLTLATDNSTEEFNFYVPASNLNMSITQTAYSNDQPLSIYLSNIGGVNTMYNYSVILIDAKGFILYKTNAQGIIAVDETKTLSFIIPSQAVSGQYLLMAKAIDLTSGRATDLTKTCMIDGLSAKLASKTDKTIYQNDENINLQTNIKNLAGSLGISNANLSIAVYSEEPSALANIGFEAGDLTTWMKGTVTEFADVIASDNFIDEDYGQNITVTPYEGKYMLRLGNPSPKTPQPIGSNEIIKNITITGPTLSLAYNIFTYDYTGWDHFSYRLTYLNGTQIAYYQQTSWGEGIELKTSGWLPIDIDVSKYIGQTLTITINCGGTGDQLYRTWAYVDGNQTQIGTLWKKDTAINLEQSQETTLTNTIDIANELKNATGKFYLKSTLSTYGNQVLNESQIQTFYITNNNYSLTLDTDKQIYKPNDTVTANGTVVNNGQVVDNFNLTVTKDDIAIFAKNITLNPGESYQYSTSIKSIPPFTLKASVKNITISQYVKIQAPAVSFSIISPDVVGLNPFDAGILLENTGDVEAQITASIQNTTWALTLPPKESQFLKTQLTIKDDIILTAKVAGDVQKSAQKNIVMGEKSIVALNPQIQYLEGNVDVPYTITNIGLLDSIFNTTFTIDNSSVAKQFFVPKGETINGDVAFNLSEGQYILTCNSPYGKTNATVNVLTGPSFSITFAPNSTTAVAGQSVTIQFKVKNTGGIEGDGELHLTIPGIYDQINKSWIGPTKEDKVSFTIPVPDDLEEKIYKGTYQLGNQTGEIYLEVQGAKVDANASLDKQFYVEGDTAILTIKVNNLGTSNLDLFSRTEFNQYFSTQPLSLSGFETKSVSFSIPVHFTGNKIFYGIYMSSGRALYLNTIYPYEKPQDGAGITVYSDKQNYSPGETVTVFAITTKDGQLNLTAPNYSVIISLKAGSTTTLNWKVPDLKSGTYYINYQFNNFSNSYPIDINGYSAKILEFNLDKQSYNIQDHMVMNMLAQANRNFTGKIKFTINGQSLLDTFEVPVTFQVGENKIQTGRGLQASQSGIYFVQYTIYGNLAGQALIPIAQGKEYFDVIGSQYKVSFNQVGSEIPMNVTYRIDNSENLTGTVPFAVNVNTGQQITYSFQSIIQGMQGVQYILTNTTPNSPQTVSSSINVYAYYKTQYRLTVTNGEHGTTSGSGWYDADSRATFNISPTTLSGSTGVQYVFNKWQGSGTGAYTGTEATHMIAMKNPINETATWTTQYQITFTSSPEGKGTITPNSQNYYAEGSMISVSATPNTGYTFWNWSTTNPSITFKNSTSATTIATVGGIGTIKATFALTLSKNENIELLGYGNIVIITGGNHNINATKATATTIIKNGQGNNVLNLGEGNNVIKEIANGNDIIMTGNGDNTISIVGNGNYQITTSKGNDAIQITGNGNSIIMASDGNKQVAINGNGNNQITTGSGNDIVAAGNGNNNISTGAGNDQITVGNGNNTVDGGSGTDICKAGTGTNKIINCEK